MVKKFFLTWQKLRKTWQKSVEKSSKKLAEKSWSKISLFFNDNKSINQMKNAVGNAAVR